MKVVNNSGILLIDKSPGPTSFDMVRGVKRLFKVRKAGHLGTLDPFATGLLVICLGEATKLAPFLMGESKTYEAAIRLGVETDTQDLTGKVIAILDKLPEPGEIYAAAARFVGEIEQVPPMYSAVHHQGQRLYKLARRGEEVERRLRPVTVHRLEVRKIALPEVAVTVTCSSGTYIRTLAADLGAALGCGGHLTRLRRLAVGPFKVEDALALETIGEMTIEERQNRLIPLAECLPGLPAVAIGEREALRLRRGQAIAGPLNGFQAGQQVRVMSGPDLVAVAQMCQGASQMLLAPVRVFHRGDQ
jgi:tRNA pseudouridine55 synthase